MNELYTQEFVKQALQSGVPQEKIAALLQRADEISTRTTKTAGTQNTDIIGDLLTGANMEKSASSVSYVHGILNEAFTNGANIPQAIVFAKTALDATNERLAFMQKVSSIKNDANLNQYAEGFMNSAKQAGMTENEALELLVDLVDKEKQANDGMFKQPSDSQAQGADAEGTGAPPVGQPAHGSDEEAQIIQMLQSLPPEEQQQIIQQLLAAISGGQGGLSGPPPSAGGLPPSAGGPPPGAMAPGGPQGPV